MALPSFPRWFLWEQTTGSKQGEGLETPGDSQAFTHLICPTSVSKETGAEMVDLCATVNFFLSNLFTNTKAVPGFFLLIQISGIMVLFCPETCISLILTYLAHPYT